MIEAAGNLRLWNRTVLIVGAWALFTDDPILVSDLVSTPFKVGDESGQTFWPAIPQSGFKIEMAGFKAGLELEPDEDTSLRRVEVGMRSYAFVMSDKGFLLRISILPSKLNWVMLERLQYHWGNSKVEENHSLAEEDGGKVG